MSRETPGARVREMREGATALIKFINAARELLRQVANSGDAISDAPILLLLKEIADAARLITNARIAVAELIEQAWQGKLLATSSEHSGDESAHLQPHGEVRESLSIPIEVDEGTSGVVRVFGIKGHHGAPQDELEMSLQPDLQALSLCASTVLQCFYRLRQIQYFHLSRMQLISEIARDINLRFDLPSIVRHSIAFLECVMPETAILVFALRGVGGKFAFLGESSLGSNISGMLGVNIGDEIPMDMFRDIGAVCSGQCVKVDATSRSQFQVARLLASLGWQSMLLSCIEAGGEFLGIMVAARQPENAFTEADRHFFKMLSDQLAIAMRNAMLYSELQRAYDEQKRARQKMMQEERLRALGQLASGIVHDIKNSLVPIIGYSELLLDYMDLTDEVRRYVDLIRRAGVDIANTVERIREFYRQRAPDERLASINLNEIVRQCIELTKPRWKDIPQRHGITIDVRTELQEPPVQISGVESELREALINLIINAADAMPNGGTLTIRTRSEQHEGSQKPQWVLLEVSDTGIGMDEETKQRCLEPFFTTKGERGTGLGLSVVYGVVQRHNGVLEIESAPNIGTTVRIKLPVVEPAELRHRDDHNAGIREGEAKLLRILVIDDEPFVREFLKRALEQEGHQVEVAQDGNHGMEKFMEGLSCGKPFDIVITDLGMPYLDGKTLTRMIKERSPTTTVIITSGWNIDQSDGNARDAAGADFLLPKPVSLEQLRMAISACVKKLSKMDS